MEPVQGVDPPHAVNASGVRAPYICSRDWVFHHAGRTSRLDAREVAEQPKDSTGRSFVVDARAKSWVSIAEHSRYKFLLALDGATASQRLAKLLFVNSVVLKEDSGRGEYYSPALQEGVHFLPIFRAGVDDLFDTMDSFEPRCAACRGRGVTEMQRTTSPLNAPPFPLHRGAGKRSCRPLCGRQTTLRRATCASKQGSSTGVARCKSTCRCSHQARCRRLLTRRCGLWSWHSCGSGCAPPRTGFPLQTRRSSPLASSS